MAWTNSGHRQGRGNRGTFAFDGFSECWGWMMKSSPHSADDSTAIRCWAIVEAQTSKPVQVELPLIFNRGWLNIIRDCERTNEVSPKGSLSHLVSVNLQASAHAATHTGRVR